MKLLDVDRDWRATPNDRYGAACEQLANLGLKRKGPMFQCPAHDDERPSLSVNRSTKHPWAVLLFCHAGCSLEKILAALGWTEKDLCPRVTREKAFSGHVFPSNNLREDLGNVIPSNEAWRMAPRLGVDELERL